jgi:hypothetical protein
MRKFSVPLVTNQLTKIAASPAGQIKCSEAQGKNPTNESLPEVVMTSAMVEWIRPPVAGRGHRCNEKVR